jgi:hypothetical protein
MSVEVLPEKKARPTPHISGVGTPIGASNSDVGSDAKRYLGQLSKNKFKHLNKRLQGQHVEFWVHDYVEKYVFNPAIKEHVDYMIMGETDSLDAFKHVVRGEVNINTLGLLDIDAIDNYFFGGVISHCTYDARLKQLELHVVNIKKLPPSIPTQGLIKHEETSTTLH